MGLACFREPSPQLEDPLPSGLVRLMEPAKLMGSAKLMDSAMLMEPHPWGLCCLHRPHLDGTDSAMLTRSPKVMDSAELMGSAMVMEPARLMDSAMLMESERKLGADVA